LTTGNRLSIRTVQSGGQDVFYPSVPLVLTAATAPAAAWPLALANAVNAQNGNIRIGVLGALNVVTPTSDATANRIFAQVSASVTGAFLQVLPAAASCRVTYQIINQWPTGFQADVSITNTSAAIPVFGYTLTWSMATGEAFANGWNATYIPSGQTLAASNTAGNWNGVIAANGGRVAFGFLGNRGASAASLPVDFRLNGEPCTVGSQTAGLAPPSNSGFLLASWIPQALRHRAFTSPPPHHCHMASSAPELVQAARVVEGVRNTETRGSPE
jgi:chitin-binding protein